MRKHRFFLDAQLIKDQLVVLEKDLSHYVSRVLRLQVGDVIYLFNNTDQEFSATIQKIAHNKVTIFITQVTQKSLESPCKINLAQVLGKGEKMDLVVQKATELGAHSITPLFSDFAIVKNVPERSTNKLEHWQRIAVAACCQSGRNTIPTIHPPQNLKQWIDQNQDQAKLLLNPHAASNLRDLAAPASISVLIGPEGGFSPTEIEYAQAGGFMPISLGPRILRTETAGIVVIAVLQALYGDL